jgi:hypothetical protein
VSSPPVADGPADPSAPAPPAAEQVVQERAPDLARRRFLVRAGAAAVVVAAAAVTLDLVRPQGRPGSPPGGWTLVPHRGLGAWVDAYDWTVALGGARPKVGPKDVEAMARAGVQTLYLQTSHRRSADDVMEPDRLDDLIDSAHANHLHVVAWYLPTFVDVDRDVARLVAASELRVDGLGVDIESVAEPDPAVRNGRVLEVSRRVRAALGDDRTLGAITLSATHVQVVNPAYWPGYPWADIGATYDVVLPMSYWTLRRGDLRAGARYVAEDIDRVRASAGADVPIHAIGGLAAEATPVDLEGMVTAIGRGGAIGGSLYDWGSSTRSQWAVLAPLRRLRASPG